jgi:hypothetical protein
VAAEGAQVLPLSPLLLLMVLVLLQEEEKGEKDWLEV